MSAIAAWWRGRSRAPVGRSSIGRMLEEQRHRGPDGMGIWVDGPAGVGVARLDVTPESVFDGPPVVSANTRCVVAFDGRIDNRDELFDLLDVRAGDRRIGDTGLLAQAYERWGTDTPQRLRGDFAFVVWDPTEQRVFAARDPIGMRPLHYRETVDGVALASEMQALVRPPFDRPQPNEGFVGEILAGTVTSTGDTLFADVVRLRGGHHLIATQGCVRTRRYWVPQVHAQVSASAPGEREEQLQALLVDAVACRMRARGKVGVLLSGGIDSAALAGIGARLVRGGKVPAEALETYTLSFPGHACDEGARAREIVAFLDVPSVTVPNPARYPQVADARRYWGLPTQAGGASADPIREQARARGVSTLMTGIGPDDWLAGGPAFYADMLVAGRFRQFAQHVAHHRRQEGAMDDRTLAREILWPLVPTTLQRIVRRVLRRGHLPAWLREPFVRRCDLRERLRAIDSPPPLGSRGRDEMWQASTSGEYVYNREELDRSMGGHGLEHSHPFEDVRLIELGFSLPPEDLIRGEFKALFRRAVRPFVPPSIVPQRDRPDYSWVVAEALDVLDAQARFASPPPTVREWIDTGTLVSYWTRWHERTRASAADLTGFWELWCALSVDIWAREALASSSPPLIDRGEYGRTEEEACIRH